MSNRASKQPSVLDQNLLLCKLQICRNRCLINLTLNQIFAMLTFNNKEFLEKWFHSIIFFVIGKGKGQFVNMRYVFTTKDHHKEPQKISKKTRMGRERTPTNTKSIYFFTSTLGLAHCCAIFIGPSTLLCYWS